MNLLRIILPVFTLAILFSCETESFEDLQVCLPERISTTLIQGTTTTRIIADFHYLPDSRLIDHITWSNHRTDYFAYDGTGRLTMVSQVRVDEKLQQDMIFEYEGEKVTGAKLVDRNLDYTYLEPVDSAMTGRVSYHYDGERIIREKRFSISAGQEVLQGTTEYHYDVSGNITSRTNNISGESPETTEFTYDSNRHPFSALAYYFSGESFVNHPLTKSSEYSNMDFHYQVKSNASGFPEMVYETLGGSNTSIIRYSYIRR